MHRLILIFCSLANAPSKAVDAGADQENDGQSIVKRLRNKPGGVRPTAVSGGRSKRDDRPHGEMAELMLDVTEKDATIASLKAELRSLKERNHRL